MQENENLKLNSRLMIFLISSTVFVFIIGILAIFFGGAIEETVKLFEVTEPMKMHFYSFAKIIVQAILYALLFFVPGFFIASSILPRMHLFERSILSIAIATLFYTLFINIFIAIIQLQNFVSAQIFWELLYIVLLSVFGFVAWRRKLAKLKKEDTNVRDNK